MQTLMSPMSSAPEAIQPIQSASSSVIQRAVALPTRAARTHTAVTRALLGGVMLQIFFAGLAIFGVSSFLPHAILGPLIILGSLALPIIAWRGRLDASLHHRSWLVFGLMIVQGLLIDGSRLMPLIGAFHPLNAMLLALLVASMARLTPDR